MQPVLTAGFVMGIMIIPFVSSLSDDIITQVPRALRDGSLGLGATNLKRFVRWFYQQHYQVLQVHSYCCITCHW
jgi:ABC-type phosphate transport system permease subunit